MRRHPPATLLQDRGPGSLVLGRPPYYEGVLLGLTVYTVRFAGLGSHVDTKATRYGLVAFQAE